MSDPVTSAEEGAKCASEWRQIERVWRDAGLPEWFLGNGGTNHGLYRFVDAVRSTAESEVSRLSERLAKVEAERDSAVEAASGMWSALLDRADQPVRDRIAVLEDALKPFVDHADRYADWLRRGIAPNPHNEHFAAARAALKETRDGDGGAP